MSKQAKQDVNFADAFNDAMHELEQRLLDQRDIELRILSLRKKVNALAILCDEQGVLPTNWRANASVFVKEALESSVTEDVLKVVDEYPRALTSTEIQHELEKLGTLAKHKNPLATINAVLGRLEQQGKVKTCTKNDRKAWRSTRSWG